MPSIFPRYLHPWPSQHWVAKRAAVKTAKPSDLCSVSVNSLIVLARWIFGREACFGHVWANADRVGLFVRYVDVNDGCIKPAPKKNPSCPTGMWGFKVAVCFGCFKGSHASCSQPTNIAYLGSGDGQRSYLVWPQVCLSRILRNPVLLKYFDPFWGSSISLEMTLKRKKERARFYPEIGQNRAIFL